jgi:hypothetical protein
LACPAPVAYTQFPVNAKNLAIKNYCLLNRHYDDEARIASDQRLSKAAAA